MAPRERIPNPMNSLVWGVSAFAFQGTNAHALLGEFSMEKHLVPSSDISSFAKWIPTRFWYLTEPQSLLGYVLDSNRTTVTFETELSRPRQSYLWDHIVAGSPILPGTAFLEFALSSFRTAAPEYKREIVLINASIQVPMSLRAAQNTPFYMRSDIKIDVLPSVAISSIDSNGKRAHMGAASSLVLSNFPRDCLRDEAKVIKKKIWDMVTPYKNTVGIESITSNVARSLASEESGDRSIPANRMDASLQLGSIPINKKIGLHVPAAINGYSGIELDSKSLDLYGTSQRIPEASIGRKFDFRLIQADGVFSVVDELLAKPIQQGVTAQTTMASSSAVLADEGCIATHLYDHDWIASKYSTGTSLLSDGILFTLFEDTEPAALCATAISTIQQSSSAAGGSNICTSYKGSIGPIHDLQNKTLDASKGQVYGLVKSAAQEGTGGFISVDSDPAAYSEDTRLSMCVGNNLSQEIWPDAYGTSTRGNVTYEPRLFWMQKQPERLLGPFALDPQPRGSLNSLVPIPVTSEIDPNEILVSVRAVGVNFRDVLNVLGMYPGDPGPPGGDLAGVVLKTGSNVGDRVKPGDPVFGLAPGCYGTHVRTEADMVAQIPENVSFEAASSTPVIFITVDIAFQQAADLRPGEKVLMHAAAGGVGLAAIQAVAAARGTLIATAGSPFKRGVVRSQGVDVALNSRDISFSAEAAMLGGVDVVLNSLTSPGFVAASLSCLRRGGRFVEISKRDIWSSSRVAQERPDVSFTLVAVDFLPAVAVRAAMDRLAAALANGIACPLPMVTHSLGDLATALRQMSQARHVGKIIISVPIGSASISCNSLNKELGVLVTGGLGSLGSLMVRWIAQTLGVTVIATGRNGRFSGAKSDSSPLYSLISNSFALPIHIISGDVSKREDSEHITQSNASIWKGQLAGLLHASGVLDDATLPNQTLSKILSVLGPKASAYTHLEDKNLSFCPMSFEILFSSVSSTLGSPGQANYSAANAWLDTAAKQQYCKGRKSTSVQWGAWAGAGMASQDPSTLRTVDRLGMAMVEPPEGLLALRNIIVSVHGAVITATPFKWPDIAKWNIQRKYVPTIFLDAMYSLAGDVFLGGEQEVEEVAVARMKRMTPEEYREFVVAEVNSTVASILGSADVGANESLMSAGLDSLGAVEFRSSLQSRLGAELPGTLIFDYPTIAALTVFLSESTMPIFEESEPSETAPISSEIGNLEIQEAAVLETSMLLSVTGTSHRSPMNALNFNFECMDAIINVPYDRWDVETDPLVARFGAYLLSAPLFDSSAFGITDAEALVVDPQQRLLLEVVTESAFESSKGNPIPVDSSIIVGKNH